MKQIKPFHHFKGVQIGNVEEIERSVIEIIKKSTIPDSERENSMCWEFKHSSGAIQFARLLAQKRNLDENICAIALALHDIYAIQTGLYKNHARLGVPIAKNILKDVQGLSNNEIDLILDMIAQHSDKDTFSSNPYIELAKDADTLDCFLYRNSEDYYLTIKPLSVCRFYFKRYANLRKEFGLPYYPRYECLDNYQPGWLSNHIQFKADLLPLYLEHIVPKNYNPLQENSGVVVFYSSRGVGRIDAFSVDLLKELDEKINLRKEITELVSQVNHLDRCLLIVWAPFNSYELILGKEIDFRLNSLSINSIDQFSVPLIV